MAFFNDLINLTPVQHLIKYWILWGSFILLSFVILYALNKKSPK